MLSITFTKTLNHLIGDYIPIWYYFNSILSHWPFVIFLWLLGLWYIVLSYRLLVPLEQYLIKALNSVLPLTKKYNFKLSGGLLLLSTNNNGLAAFSNTNSSTGQPLPDSGDITSSDNSVISKFVDNFFNSSLIDSSIFNLNFSTKSNSLEYFVKDYVIYLIDFARLPSSPAWEVFLEPDSVFWVSFMQTLPYWAEIFCFLYLIYFILKYVSKVYILKASAFKQVENFLERSRYFIKEHNRKMYGSIMYFLTSLLLFYGILTTISLYGKSNFIVYLFSTKRDVLDIEFASYDLYILLLKITLVFLTGISFLFLRDWFWEFPEKSIDVCMFFLISFTMLNMAIATKSLLILLLSICGISLITYVLIAFDRTYLAIEASVKYFTMSALVTGFMCFGYLILSQYNLMSNIMLDSMDQEGLFYKSLLKTSSNDGASHYFINLSQSLTLLNFGFILFLSGFIFKLSLFPFFSWAPDVYEGSPLYVVSFMVILVKFVIFCVFLRFFNSSPLYIYCVDMLSSDSSIGAVIWFLKICGFASVGIGAIGAITQQRLKRFVAYTSINQMGLMLLGILYDPIAVGAIFNIFVYVSTSLIFFGVLMSLKRIHNDTRITYMNELHNLFESSPSSTILLTISILSISGIPPLLGFFSKYMIFIPIFKSGLAASFYILFFHTVAMFNYLRVLRDIWFTDNFKDVVFFRFLSKWSFRVLWFLSIPLQIIVPIFFLNELLTFFFKVVLCSFSGCWFF